MLIATLMPAFAIDTEEFPWLKEGAYAHYTITMANATTTVTWGEAEWKVVDVRDEGFTLLSRFEETWREGGYYDINSNFIKYSDLQRFQITFQFPPLTHTGWRVGDTVQVGRDLFEVTLEKTIDTPIGKIDAILFEPKPNTDNIFFWFDKSQGILVKMVAPYYGYEDTWLIDKFIPEGSTGKFPSYFRGAPSPIVKVGSSVRLGSGIEPGIPTVLTVTVTAPDGKQNTERIHTDEYGNFDYTFTPTQEGIWKVEFRSEGSEHFKPATMTVEVWVIGPKSFTINAPSSAALDEEIVITGSFPPPLMRDVEIFFELPESMRTKGYFNVAYHCSSEDIRTSFECNDDGTFQYQLILRASGTWRVYLRYSGITSEIIEISVGTTEPTPPEVTEEAEILAVEIANNYDTELGTWGKIIRVFGAPVEPISVNITVRTSVPVSDIKFTFNEDMEVWQHRGTPDKEYKFTVKGPSTLTLEKLVDIVKFGINIGMISTGSPPIFVDVSEPEIPVVYIMGIEYTYGGKTHVKEWDANLPSMKDTLFDVNEDVWSDILQVVLLESPAVLMITDEEGRRVGAFYQGNTLVEVNELPDAFYSGKDAKAQFIALQSIHKNITATGTGVGQINVVNYVSDDGVVKKQTLKSKVEVTPRQVLSFVAEISSEFVVTETHTITTTTAKITVMTKPVEPVAVSTPADYTYLYIAIAVVIIVVPIAYLVGVKRRKS